MLRLHHDRSVGSRVAAVNPAVRALGKGLEWVAIGEAKLRKRLPCICGSADPAGRCCWTSHGYHKKPVVVDLHNTGLTGKHDKCYMAATGACDTKIWRRPLIAYYIGNILSATEMTAVNPAAGLYSAASRGLCQ